MKEPFTKYIEDKLKPGFLLIACGLPFQSEGEPAIGPGPPGQFRAVDPDADGRVRPLDADTPRSACGRRRASETAAVPDRTVVAAFLPRSGDLGGLPPSGISRAEVPFLLNTGVLAVGPGQPSAVEGLARAPSAIQDAWVHVCSPRSAEASPEGNRSSARGKRRRARAVSLGHRPR